MNYNQICHSQWNPRCALTALWFFRRSLSAPCWIIPHISITPLLDISLVLLLSVPLNQGHRAIQSLQRNRNKRLPVSSQHRQQQKNPKTKQERPLVYRRFSKKQLRAGRCGRLVFNYTEKKTSGEETAWISAYQRWCTWNLWRSNIKQGCSRWGQVARYIFLCGSEVIWNRVLPHRVVDMMI